MGSAAHGLLRVLGSKCQRRPTRCPDADGARLEIGENAGIHDHDRGRSARRRDCGARGARSRPARDARLALGRGGLSQGTLRLADRVRPRKRAFDPRPTLAGVPHAPNHRRGERGERRGRAGLVRRPDRRERPTSPTGTSSSACRSRSTADRRAWPGLSTRRRSASPGRPRRVWAHSAMENAARCRHAPSSRRRSAQPGFPTTAGRILTTTTQSSRCFCSGLEAFGAAAPHQSTSA